MNYYGQYQGQYISHFGRSKTDGAPGRGSGRYPLGSGDRPYQNQPQLSKSQVRRNIRKLNRYNTNLEYINAKKDFKEKHPRIWTAQNIASLGQMYLNEKFDNRRLESGTKKFNETMDLLKANGVQLDVKLGVYKSKNKIILPNGMIITSWGGKKYTEHK